MASDAARENRISLERRLRRLEKTGERAMAKGQMRPQKEKKKPKQDKNKKKKGGPAISPFAAQPAPGQPGGNPFAKKG
jgi:hypothetical protein